MRTKFFLITIFSLTLSLSSTLWAVDSGGLFIEPGLSYQVGDSDVDYPDPSNDSEADIKGLGFLFRLGFHINEMFFLAADARYNFLDFKDSNSNYDVDAHSYNLSPVVGLQFPDMGLRAWASWILAGEIDPKEANGFDVKFNEASGYRIGGGFRLHSFSINLEHEKINYNGATFTNPLNLTGSASNLDLDANAWIASLSFPVEI